MGQFKQIDFDSLFIEDNETDPATAENNSQREPWRNDVT